MIKHGRIVAPATLATGYPHWLISGGQSPPAILGAMARPSAALTRGTSNGSEIIRRLMHEAEAARVASGTSFASIGRALRLAPSQVAAILRGQSPELTIVRAAQVLEAVGLELSARAYPVGAPVRDAAQQALLARFRVRVHRSLSWRTEVPVAEIPVVGDVDRRAWDVGIDGPGVRVRVDAETHVGDLQAVDRRVALKQRDGHEACVILLLAKTKHHRILLDLAGDALRHRYPVSQRAALAALQDGRQPDGSALVLL